jgi:glycosyltransferase involved in cell wall biosynthesis
VAKFVDLLTSRLDCLKVGVSDFVSRELELKLGSPILTIWNGVTVRDFNRYPSRIRSGDADIYILVLGRLHPVKGHLFLLEAIASVVRRQKISGAHFHIVGSGSLYTSIETRISELGLSGTVVLHGGTSEVEKYYAAADGFLSCSSNEGFGLSVLEAMSYGLPCALSSIEAHKFLAQDTGAIFFDPYKSDDLQEKLVEFIDSFSNRSTIHAISNTSFQRAGDFNVQTQARIFWQSIG